MKRSEVTHVVLLALKILIGLGALSWVLSLMKSEALFVALQKTNWLWIGAFALTQIAGYYLSAKRWRYIAWSRSLRMKSWDAFRIYLTGAFMNNFLPLGTFGGDAFRSAWLASKLNNRAGAVASVFFDRFVGLWVVSILALVLGVWWYVRAGSPFSGFVLMLSILALALLVDALLTWVGRLPGGSRIIDRLPYVVRRLCTEFLRVGNERAWWGGSVYALAFHLVATGLGNWFLFEAFGLHLDPLYYIGVIFLTTLIASLPVSIGNIGVKEGAYVLFFGHLIAVEPLFLVVTVGRFVQFLITGLAWPLYAREMWLLRRAKQAEARAAEEQ